MSSLNNSVSEISIVHLIRILFIKKTLFLISLISITIFSFLFAIFIIPNSYTGKIMYKTADLDSTTFLLLKQRFYSAKNMEYLAKRYQKIWPQNNNFTEIFKTESKRSKYFKFDTIPSYNSIRPLEKYSTIEITYKTPSRALNKTIFDLFSSIFFPKIFEEFHYRIKINELSVKNTQQTVDDLSRSRERIRKISYLKKLLKKTKKHTYNKNSTINTVNIYGNDKNSYNKSTIRSLTYEWLKPHLLLSTEQKIYAIKSEIANNMLIESMESKIYSERMLIHLFIKEVSKQQAYNNSLIIPILNITVNKQKHPSVNAYLGKFIDRVLNSWNTDYLILNSYVAPVSEKKKPLYYAVTSITLGLFLSIFLIFSIEFVNNLKQE